MSLKIRKAIAPQSSVDSEKHALAEAVGYFTPAAFTLLEITGVDAERFINAQTTSDVKSLAPGQFQPSALLDRKAHVVAYFYLYRTTGGYSIIADSNQMAAIIEHLDRYIFADKVELEQKSGSFTALIGSDSRALLDSYSNNELPFDSDAFAVTDTIFAFRAPLSSRESFLLYTENQAENLLAQLTVAAQAHKPAISFEELGEQELTAERVEAGVAQMGKDFGSENLIIELGLENDAVSYTKGCFQGQEVLARVKGHGSPAKQLAGLIITEIDSAADIVFALGSSIKLAETDVEIGKIYSNGVAKRGKYSGKHLALAILKRDYRTPGRTERAVIQSADGTVPATITVTMLPFSERENLEQKAKSLYQEALSLYSRTGDSQENVERAINNLRRALLFDRRLEDAYEALGVILSKEGQIDEAISLMESLAALNPDSIMAYANLSVFYLERNGDKEKAEDAKAQSMAIRMRLAAREAMQEHKEKEDTAKIEAEALERKAMFEQVIEIDPDDLFANNGLGNCHNILKQYAEAEPFLLKAISIKPAHTVAYLELGTTYEGLQNIDKAIATYKKGIDVAAQKGDMTPLKAMQARLDALSSQS